MIEIPFPNAFTLNSLVLGELIDSLFPFSVEFNQQDKVSSLFLCPQRVEDICDLLETYALKMITVFDVESSSDLTIVERAKEVKIEFSQIDLSTIVISLRDLYRLLSGFNHYDIHLFDIDPEWNEEEIISQVLTCREYDWHSHIPILPSLRYSRSFLYCHDNCYLTLESYNLLFLRRVFARALRIYAGTVFLEEKLQMPHVLSEISNDIIDNIWNNKLDLTILRDKTTYDHGKLHIGVSKRAFTFRERSKYPIEFLIEYDVANQTWTIIK